MDFHPRVEVEVAMKRSEAEGPVHPLSEEEIAKGVDDEVVPIHGAKVLDGICDGWKAVVGRGIV
jgi:hypothetical protein